MKVELYNRKKDKPATELLEAVTPETTLVRVQASDYDEPYIKDLDFEDRILPGSADLILPNPDKLVGIIDLELFMASHMYQYFNEGDIVKFPGGTYIKTGKAYIPAEFKE